MVFGAFDPLVVVERYRPLGDVEPELAERALIDLPAVMGLFEEGVDERLDRVAQRAGLPLPGPFSSNYWVPRASSWSKLTALA